MAESLASLITKLGWLAIREWILPMVNLDESIRDVMPELDSTITYLQMVEELEKTSILLEKFNKEVRDLANLVEDAMDDYVLHCSEILIKKRFLLMIGASVIRQIGTQYKIAKTVKELKPKFKEARDRFSQQSTLLKASVGSSSSASTSQTDNLWINLRTDSNQEELLREVIEMYCQEGRQLAPYKLETMNRRTLKQKILRFLENERYLIILDDVRALEKWNAWFPVFPYNDNGSRVIITTQDAEVAYGSQVDSFPMEYLSENESQQLFRLKAFGDENCPEHLSGMEDRVLQKCGGMPLGITAIGGLLREKDQKLAEWLMIIDGLETELQGKLRDINTILLRCYYHMPYNLKPCLLYMTIFPEEHLIGHLKLIRLWVAEGFVTECQGKTADDVAEGYLSQLVSRCLIQVAERRSDGRVKSYQLHGLMRIILTTRAKDQNFVARNISDPTARRLSVQDSLKFQGRLDKLRSLLLFDVDKKLDKFTMPVLFNGKSKLLTVLDLEGSDVHKFPSSITGLLNLRYLSLRNTKIKEIPSSIEKLQKLETLDLKRTVVQKLPQQIKQLQNLQNLLLYRYGDDKNGAFPSKHGFQAPEGMGALKSLQKLCFIEASKDSGNIVKELSELKRLRRLGIVKLSTKHEAALWSSIKQMSWLRALSVTASIGETMDLRELCSPPKCLERLYLTGTLKSFPTWTKSTSLGNLVKIFLKSSNLDEEPLTSLGNLKNLIHIELQQVYNGKEFHFRRNNFQKLRILGVRKLEYLDSVTIEENSMPNLEKLLFQECRQLKTLPDGINRLLNLKVLDFVEMPGEIYTKMTIPSSDEFNSIQHIPQVSFATYVDQHWDIQRVSTLVNNFSAGESSTSADKRLVKGIKNFGKK